MVAVARRGMGDAQLCRFRPPYNEWNRTDLDRYIGGPLLVKWGNRYLVGGRNSVDDTYITRFCWLANDTLHTAAALPSGGDNSYPGFIELSPSRALVSYYSSHEKDGGGTAITAIYLAELEIE